MNNKALQKIINRMNTSPVKPSLDKGMVRQLKAVRDPKSLRNQGSFIDGIISPTHKDEMHTFLRGVYAN